MDLAVAPRRSKKILIVAGEESGDVYAGRLAGHLGRLIPGVAMEGIGGPRMRQAGVETFHDIAHMSSVGVASALGRLRGLFGMLADIKRRLNNGDYGAVILVDYPDFNMQVAKAAHGAGVPVFYYVCPQFWAWRRGRAQKAKIWVDLMMVVFPFEEKYYQDLGLEAVFSGHPLLDELPPLGDKLALKRSLGAREDKPLVGLAPGSREGEVKRMFPLMLEAGRIIKESMDVDLLVPCAKSIDPARLCAVAEEMGVQINLVEGRTWEAMNAVDFLICKSGTSTLQAALAQAPMVIVYKADLFSYYMAKALSHVEWAGLPNILAGRMIVPELLQGQATAPAMAREALRILRDEGARRAMIEDLAKIRQSLGEPGASQRAARIISGRLGGEFGGAEAGV